jgi:hypothetical protein
MLIVILLRTFATHHSFALIDLDETEMKGRTAVGRRAKACRDLTSMKYGALISA